MIRLFEVTAAQPPKMYRTMVNNLSFFPKGAVKATKVDDKGNPTNIPVVQWTETRGQRKTTTEFDPEIFNQLISIIPGIKPGQTLEQTVATIDGWEECAKYMTIFFSQNPKTALEDLNKEIDGYTLGDLFAAYLNYVKTLNPQDKGKLLKGGIGKPNYPGTKQTGIKPLSAYLQTIGAELENRAVQGKTMLMHPDISPKTAKYEEIVPISNLKSGGWAVVVPLNKEGDQLFGGNYERSGREQDVNAEHKNFTSWCTAGINSNMFNSYQNVPLFIFLKADNGEQTEYASWGFQRWQLYFDKTNPYMGDRKDDNHGSVEDYTNVFDTVMGDLSQDDRTKIWEYYLKAVQEKTGKTRIPKSAEMCAFSDAAKAFYDKPMESIEDALAYYGIESYRINPDVSEEDRKAGIKGYVEILGDYTYTEGD